MMPDSTRSARHRADDGTVVLLRSARLVFTVRADDQVWRTLIPDPVQSCAEGPDLDFKLIGFQGEGFIHGSIQKTEGFRMRNNVLTRVHVF